MKKAIILILIVVIVIVSIVFANYVEFSKKKTEIEILNKEFLAYENSNVQINTIITLMNKAIEKNKENEIPQDENRIFQENDTNSIKLYLELKSSNAVIPMEELMLNEKAGMQKVGLAFSDLLFNITDIEYHKNTGQIKKVVFTAIENTDVQ